MGNQNNPTNNNRTEFGVIDDYFKEWYETLPSKQHLRDFIIAKTRLFEGLACFITIIFSDQEKYGLSDDLLPLSEIIGERLAIIRKILNDLLKNEEQTSSIIDFSCFCINKSCDLFNYRFDFNNISEISKQYDSRINNHIKTAVSEMADSNADIMGRARTYNRIMSFYLGFRDSFLNIFNEYSQ